MKTRSNMAKATKKKSRTIATSKYKNRICHFRTRMTFAGKKATFREAEI